MTFAASARRASALAAAALTAVLAACAPTPPPAPPPAPPPVAVAPPVTLSPRLVEQAAAYQLYMRNVTAISPAFTDGDSVARSLKVGASYEPQQLLRGAVAYAAVLALQDPAYVAGVRTYALDAQQRRMVAAEILKDPAYAVGFSGSASAAGLIKATLGDQGQRLLDAGKAVKQAAYDVQHSPWSKADVLDRPGRLALAKTLSSTPITGDMAETARLQQAALGAAPLGVAAQPANPPYTPLVIRGLAVAALAALGQAGDANLEQVMPVMGEPASGSCLNMSKLNLYQCLAVSKPHYEDVFCLGQHVMMDTGVCMIKGSGMPAPLEIRTQPLKVEPVTAPAKPKARKASAKKG